VNHPLFSDPSDIVSLLRTEYRLLELDPEACRKVDRVSKGIHKCIDRPDEKVSRNNWNVVIHALAIFGFPRDIPAFTCLAILLFPLLAVTLIIGFLTLFLFGRRKPQAALAMMLVMSIGTLGFFKGFMWGARIHLLVNEDRYAEKIRELYTACSSEE
jgi:hypothetical protein